MNEMYYSQKKRKMFMRILTVLTFCVTAYVLLSGLSKADLDVCTWMPFSSLLMLCPHNDASEWNLFYHLGGNGPWIPRASAGDGTLPMKCVVDQAHMLSRHAERYPTANVGKRHLKLYRRLNKVKSQLTGSMAFLKDWEYFTNATGESFDDLVRTGPFAGTTQSFETGLKLRKRYNSLIHANKTTKYWTCASDRDIETAKFFGNGFFGADWKDGAAELITIPETAERGADTLTPGDTCLAYINDTTEGHDQGITKLDKWQKVFTKPIAERLGPEAGNLKFSPVDIYSMMEMCGFEILVKGSSPWCDVFTHEEWLDFEYGRDLLHYYRAGPGNKYAPVMGTIWLSATTTLLQNAEATGFYASFVHDGDIVPLLATLGIFGETTGAGKLPSNKRIDSRNWKTSDIVPMGGRLIFERVTCSNTGLGQNLRRSYVRLFINDGLFEMEKSLTGGGLAHAIGIKQWSKMVEQKTEQAGDFRTVCGLSRTAPSRISFLQPQYD